MKGVCNMIEQLLFTDASNFVLFVLRLFLALVIFPHGAQKLLGWFGGFGFSGTMGFFTQTMRLPWLISFLVIAIESLGALALLAGFTTRLTALGLIAVMIGAILTSHRQYGFFMNWFGQQEGEGFEFHLLVIGLALALVLGGGGAWSVDSLVLTSLAG
jgi:putative oxidoreductase